MGEEEKIRMESEAALDLLRCRYGDRLTPEMADGLRASVEAVVKTAAAIRSVRLGNGDAPLVGFAPSRTED